MKDIYYHKIFLLLRKFQIQNTFPLIISILLTVFLFSCESNNNQTIRQKFHKPDVSKRTKLVALTGNNAYSYFIYKGKTMGFEYELLQRFGKAIGKKIEIKVVKSIKEMIEKIRKGEGDLIALNLTVTKERKEIIDFTKPLHKTKQVLVQRLPDNWRKLTADKIDRLLIRDPIDLEGKTVYVRHSSAYIARLKNLSDEIGGDINIVEADDSLSVEDLILKVSEGEIDYTIADENIAVLNQEYLPNIDVKTKISFSQKIAWAVEKGDTSLLKVLNNWIDKIKNTKDFYIVYNRYYQQRYYYKFRRKSKYFLSQKGRISPYDELFKKCIGNFCYDWRLLAAIAYIESQFDANAKSWMGAIGIMQLLPETGKKFGATNLYNPKENIQAGVKYLAWLDKFWSKYIKDKDERIKFVLASYNIGYGHVLDAYKLAEKYGAKKNIWDNNVEKYLLKKSNEKYYTDEVVKNGYCNCIETVKYVKDVITKFEQYKQFTK